MKICTVLAVVASLIVAPSCVAQQSLPVQLPPQVITGRSDTCPAAYVTEQARNDTKIEIQSLLRDFVVPELDRLAYNGPPCPCGGRGQWTRLAFLNMSDPSQQCPTSWILKDRPVRGCGRRFQGCNSVTFTASGQSYSRVCGRVNGYQRSTTGAFAQSVGVVGSSRLENAYVDGVSLTHGAEGSRQHIWSFASAAYETSHNNVPFYLCPCINPSVTWPYQVPSFVGNDYFCDSGDPTGNGPSATLLWDGEGCGPTSACCEFNTPPWFCKTLAQPTTDDLEVRLCNDGFPTHEDNIITLVDIYVM